MQDCIFSGRFALWIIILTGVEAVALLSYRRFTRRGPAAADFLPAILAGDFLLLAWFMASTHSRWIWPAMALLAALLSHLVDMGRHWPSRGR